jgi:hypothetical protein
MKTIKMTQAVKDFIVDMMSEGLDISQIADRFPDKVPSISTIYKQTLNDSEFQQKVNQGYTVLLMHRMDELHRISGQTASEAYPEIGDWRQAEAVLKRRMDEAKFVLGKLAPILSSRFNKVEKIEVSVAEKLAIVDYSTAKIERDITPNEEEL